MDAPALPADVMLIGLLGGIASGKSLVASLFRQQGAGVLDADRAGHEVLQEPAVQRLLVARWGASVLDEQGEADRTQIARRVFAPPPGGPAELAWLESVTHPRITHRIWHAAAELAAHGARILVVDAPLLLKAGWDRYCRHVVFVDAPRNQRLARAQARGWTEEQFNARESQQEPLEVKRSRADVVLDNSGSPAATAAAVRRLWDSWSGAEPAFSAKQAP